MEHSTEVAMSPSASQSTSSSDESSPSLEKALEQLDSIVGEMESGDLPLEALIEKFERGVALVKLCRNQLASAEKRVERITGEATDEPGLAPFDPQEDA